MPSQSHLSKAKILATPTDTPYHARIASPRASRARSWQQMMRARLGIDKTKSWADWAEEEEEAAEPTKTLADAALTGSEETAELHHMPLPLHSAPQPPSVPWSADDDIAATVLAHAVE